MKPSDEVALPPLSYRQNYLNRISQDNAELFNSSFFWAFKPDDVPLDPRRKFPGFDSILLEIGFGHGEVLEQLAPRYQSTAFVGIERRPYRVRKALKRLRRLGASNATLLRINLDLLDQPLFLPGSFDRILVNHPDPWPKRRHEHHRFFDLTRVDWLAALLAPGGSLEVASDHADYFFQILHLFETRPDFESMLPPPFYTPYPELNRPMSRYERKRRNAGAVVRLLRFAKVK